MVSASALHRLWRWLSAQRSPGRLVGWCGLGQRSPSGPSGRRRQGGSALIELTIALIIAAALAIYATTRLQQDADDAVATATGVYLDALASGAQRHLLVNFQALSVGATVTGTVSSLQPTLPELVALGRLPPGFPAITPSQQSARIDIQRTNCPGANCTLTATACLTTAYQARGRFREDLATVAMMAMGGRGGRSHADNPSLVRGATLNLVNPLGAVTGIVCGQSVVDTGLFDQFVRVRDTRDPALQGGLTLSGTTTTGDTLRVQGTATVAGDLMTVDPATGTACVQILSSGQLNVNCSGQLNASLGTFTGPGGQVAKVGATGSSFVVDATGRVRATDGFWATVGSLFGDNTLGARAAGTVFTIQTGAGVDALAVHDNGRTGSGQSLASPALGLTQAVTAGQACTAGAEVPATQVTAAAVTVIRALAGGGFATCAGGQWTPIARVANEGDACSPDGSTAVTQSAVVLICSGGRYVRLAARFGSLVAAESFSVADGGTVPKPVCASGATGQRVYLTPGNELQTIQYVNRFSRDDGAYWTVFLQDGNNQPVKGDLIAVTYCVY